jgi:hypothetical protein
MTSQQRLQVEGLGRTGLEEKGSCGKNDEVRLAKPGGTKRDISFLWKEWRQKISN